MKIVDFTANHIEAAASIAKRNYAAARKHVPALPLVDLWPDLTDFAQNGLGVTAFEGGEMVGFLCGYGPFENTFGIPRLRSVFSPIHANGTKLENQEKIYARLYQAAGEKWARAGAASHAICLYAHDEAAQEQFFRYGFGLRCVDAIRGMEEIIAPPCEACEFEELSQDEYISVFPLHQMLNQHQRESPFFMDRKPSTPESFINSYQKHGSRFFAAKYGGKICAYAKILRAGETFIVDNSDYIHVGGAFCLPEHRGQGVYSNLLILIPR